jgi:hypothetical protein
MHGIGGASRQVNASAPIRHYRPGNPPFTTTRTRTAPVKGYEVATLAQNKIFPAKQKPLLSEITGLPLDAQMQRNRLDLDERVEVAGSAVAHVHLVLHVRFVLVLQT